MTADARSAAVHLDHVSKQFGDGTQRREVLRDCSVTIRAGEFVSLVGPSGCGKTTLLNLVAGLLDADAGEVTIGGTSVDAATRRKDIGYVPQTPALLPWRTVRQNVQLPVTVNRRTSAPRDLPSITEMLAAFGLAEHVDRYPQQLSGGQQQRVAIARAFATNPSVLLMDEPFSALDEITRERQRMELMAFWQSNQKTVLFVTHSVEEAVSLSDRILLMSSPGHAAAGRIADELRVDLPRPRSEASLDCSGFRELVSEVRQRLRALAGGRA